MTLFSPLVRNIPARSVTRLQGVMVPAAAGSSTLAVNVNGNIIPARYGDPVVVQAGDPVAVDFVAGAQGQAEAWVAFRLGASPRPATGTVTTVPVGSQTITVTGTDGIAYTGTTFVSSYTPTVGDTVILAWNAANPTVTGKVGTTAAPPPPVVVAAPPAPSATGTSTYPSVDTSTWWGPGGWDSWSGGNNPYEGNYAGQGDLTGAWFYGGSPSELSGRTITAIRFTLGARNGAGASSSAVNVNLHTHTSANRPGGNITLGSASTVVVAQPYQPGTVYNLPTSFAADLLAGGGICIQGGPYAGFAGRNKQPDSGLLSIDWSR